MNNIFDNSNFINLVNSTTKVLSDDKDYSYQLSSEDIQAIHESVNSDAIRNKLLREELDELKDTNKNSKIQNKELRKINLALKIQIKELKQANSTLKAQLNTANKNLKKKDEIIFNQNVQIELQKTEYLRQVEETKKQETRAVLAEKELKFHRNLNYILGIISALGSIGSIYGILK